VVPLFDSKNLVDIYFFFVQALSLGYHLCWTITQRQNVVDHYV
jgi:hypothetical protein